MLFRSPYAHAVIKAIEVEDAKARPGVIGILTGSDLRPLNLGVLTTAGAKIGWKGSDFPDAPKALLPTDKARFAGEALAVVVAETKAAAMDAAERVRMSFEELPPVGTLDAAAAGQGSAIWQSAPDNRAFEWLSGNADATEKAFAEIGRAHV